MGLNPYRNKHMKHLLTTLAKGFAFLVLSILAMSLLGAYSRRSADTDAIERSEQAQRDANMRHKDLGDGTCAQSYTAIIPGSSPGRCDARRARAMCRISETGVTILATTPRAVRALEFDCPVAVRVF